LRDRGTLDILQWLKEKYFVSCSPATFSRSLPFIRQRAKSHSRELIILAKMDERRATKKFSETELFAWGQEQFAEMAIADEDPKAWALIQRTARDREQLKFDREKFEFDAAKAALAQAATLKTISISKLSDVEKITQARLALFGELPKEGKQS
jgi:hypothetical protein